MLRHTKDRHHFIAIGIILLFVLGHIFYLRDIIIDPGDGLKHFLIAKYSWKYPHLLVDHWGKPFFTLLSSPFAQFGFGGMLIFNALLFLITSILMVRIAHFYNLKYSWLAIVFCVSAPVYFMMILSGLTEILFAFAIISAVYFYLREDYFLGTIILSFSFFIRPESVAIVPWFMLYLLIKRQYIIIPLVLTAFVLYSVIGYFHYNDLFWVINKKPYSNTGTYGSGSPFNFILNYKNITGTFSFIFLLAGSLIILFRGFKSKFAGFSNYSQWTLLFIMPIVSVYVVHSLLWWKGLQGSAGLLRVIATIVPLIALVALFAINELTEYRTKLTLFVSPRIIFVGLTLISIVLIINQTRRIDINPNMIESQLILSEVADWYMSNGHDKKIYYMPPYFAYKANIDPYSEKGDIEGMRRFKNKEMPSENMNNGELILWETQFSIKEGKLLLNKLLNDKGLVLKKSFYPKNSIIFWGENYELHVFEKSQ